MKVCSPAGTGFPFCRLLRHAGYKDSFHTSQETYYASATKRSQLMLFRETVAVYCENQTEHTNTLCGQNAEFWYVKAGGTYSNHWALNDLET
jgi:hypothetical protein